jgi:hypothetical protein
MLTGIMFILMWETSKYYLKIVKEKERKKKIKGKETMNGKPTLCLDFDGVCHSYTSGWQGVDVIPDPPVDGLFEFLKAAEPYFAIHIYSTRSKTKEGVNAMRDWFEEHYPYYHTTFALHFPTSKPPALVTIDDRAITFMGEWPDIDLLRNFKPWNKQ